MFLAILTCKMSQNNPLLFFIFKIDENSVTYLWRHRSFPYITPLIATARGVLEKKHWIRYIGINSENEDIYKDLYYWFSPPQEANLI